MTLDNRNYKTIGLDAHDLTKSAWAEGISDKYYTAANASINNRAVVGGLTGIGSYEVVSQVFRCVNMRALEVSNFPRQLQTMGGEDVTDDPRYADILPKTADLFYGEASQCLTGQQYTLINEGARSGRDLRLKMVATPTVQPWYDPLTREVMYFYRVMNGRPENRHIPLDRIIYIWNPNFRDETKPGVGESQVCLGPSSGLYALDVFFAHYMNNGAVPITLFPMLPETSDPDKLEFQNLLSRSLSGMRNAFKFVAIRWRSGDLKPFQLGSSLKDIDTSGMTATQRKDIALAHGMSPNVADGGYKYATADSEYLNFILGTIVPRVESTFERRNAQFYNKLGLQLVALPNKHEVIQSAMLLQAQTVQALAGKPVISINEGRAIIELDPVANGDWPTAAELEAQKAGRVTCENCGSNNSAVAPTCVQCGAPLGKEVEKELKENKELSKQDNTADPAQIKAALSEWRKLARDNVKAGGAFVLPSAPNVIPDSLIAPINEGLSHCKTVGDVNSVFERYWPKSTAIVENRSEALVLAEAIRYAAEVLESAK